MLKLINEMKILLLLCVTLVGCKSIGGTNNSFTNLKVHFYSYHEGEVVCDFELISTDKKLLYISENVDTGVDTLQVKQGKLQKVQRFIKHTRKQKEECTGYSIAGGSSVLRLDIDGEKIELWDCWTEKIDVHDFVRFIKSKQ